MSELFELIRGRVGVGLVVAVVAHLGAYYVLDLYNFRALLETTQRAVRVLVGTLVGAFAAAVLFFFLPEIRLGRLILVFHVVLTSELMLIWRSLVYKAWPALNAPVRLILVGPVSIYEELKKNMERTAVVDVVVAGWVPLEGRQGIGNLGNPFGFRQFASLEEAVATTTPELVVLPSLNDSLSTELTTEAIKLKFQGIEVTDAVGFCQIHFGKTPVSYLNGSWVLYNAGVNNFGSKYGRGLKRAGDVIISAVLLLLTLPLMALTALFVWMDSGRPVFFWQERLGHNWITFQLLKFRTMIREAEQASGPGWTVKNDSRLTRVGRFLRPLRIDELPQLLNVLKGNMSLVGPRPIQKQVAEQLRQHLPFYDLRFTMKPGLTGWAQVHADYGDSVEGQKEKLEYDLFYVQNASPMLDTLVLVKTLNTLLFRWGQ